MKQDELLATYEAIGDEKVFVEAKTLGGSPVYSSAFLLEREGRLTEAMDTWRTLIDWSEARGYILDTLWPKQELERLRRETAHETRKPPAR